jgi:hypothetical protein
MEKFLSLRRSEPRIIWLLNDEADETLRNRFNTQTSLLSHPHTFSAQTVEEFRSSADVAFVDAYDQGEWTSLTAAILRHVFPLGSGGMLVSLRVKNTRICPKLCSRVAGAAKPLTAKVDIAVMTNPMLPQNSRLTRYFCTNPFHNRSPFDGLSCAHSITVLVVETGGNTYEALYKLGVAISANLRRLEGFRTTGRVAVGIHADANIWSYVVGHLEDGSNIVGYPQLINSEYHR